MPNLIKKIFFLFIIIFTFYIIAVFNLPAIANNIEKTLWINWFNNYIRDLKWNFDEMVTNIPSKEEFKETYNQALSWALQIKWEAVTWIETIKDWVDNVRWTLHWAWEKIDWVRENITETKSQIQNTVDAIKETSNSISDLTNSFTDNTSTWSNNETSTWNLNYNN